MISHVHRWLFVMALLVSMVASVGTARIGAQDEIPPLKVGALVPFSGDLSFFGPPLYNAIELAVNQINEAGGVNGQPIELVRADSATSPVQAVEEARRLVEIEGVSAIVGPAGSGESLQVIEAVTGPSGILQISPSATSPELTTANDNDFFFRTTISDAAQGVVLANLAQELGYASACTMFINNSYGQGLNDVFVARFQELGGQITAQVPHEGEQASYASEVAACTEGNPDVMAVLSYPESMSVFLREALETGAISQFLFTDGGRTPDLFDRIGWEAFEGMYGTTAGATESAVSEAFDRAYEEAYGTPPQLPYLREAYDALYLIALAAEKANSVDPAQLRDALRGVASEPGVVVNPGVDGWAAAVQAISEGQEVNYEGASGPAEFDEHGDIVKGVIVVWKIEGGQIVDVESRPFDLTAEAAPEATPEA